MSLTSGFSVCLMDLWVSSDWYSEIHFKWLEIENIVFTFSHMWLMVNIHLIKLTNKGESVCLINSCQNCQS